MVDSFVVLAPIPLLAVVSLLGFVGCVGDAPVVVDTKDFQLSPDSSDKHVLPGGSVNYSINVVSKGGYTGLVYFEITDPGADTFTPVFTDKSVDVPADRSAQVTLSVTTEPSSKPRDYQISFKASDYNNATHTSTVILHVGA